MARGNPSALALGPGYLYSAPIGTTEPSDLTTAWGVVSASWVSIGYTEQGSEFKYAPATGAVNVEEELDPVTIVATGRTATVTFNMSEVTATHLKLAQNGGTMTTGTGIVTFEPPDLGTEVRAMLGFEAEDHSERWVYRQCYQTGDLTISRRKGNTNATIATIWTLEKPATGSKLYKAIFATPSRQ